MSEEMASDHAISPVSSPCSRRHYAMQWLPVSEGFIAAAAIRDQWNNMETRNDKPKSNKN